MPINLPACLSTIRYRFRTLAALCLLAICSTSVAQSTTDIVIKYAELGDPEAQYVLGKLYFTGDGVKPSNSLAFDWYMKAAIQGYAKAQNRIGMIYYNGDADVPKDRAEAFIWFEKAAKQNHRVGQFYYGYQLFTGEVVLEDRELGMEWMLKAAANNCRRAKIRLARIYDNGEGGIEVDKQKAFYWYSEAAKHNISFAQSALGRMYHHGEAVEKDLSKAIEWYSLAAKRGKRSAINGLVEVYTELGESDKANLWKQKLPVK